MNARRPAWKIAAVVAGGLLVLVGIFFTWVQAVASRRWAELQSRVPVLIAEARGRENRRPVLRGEAVPGNAWADYEQGLAAIKGAKASDLGEFVGRAPKADRAKAVAAVATYEGCLAFLASGARKAEGTYPYKFEKGFAADIPGLLQSQNLANLTASKARFLVEAGKPREAVVLLLDGLQFSADLGRNTILISEMISMANLSIILEELKAMALDPAVKDVDWEDLGRALALLDGAFPENGESMLNEAASAAAGLADSQMETSLSFSESPGVLSSWRYGFSMRIMIVDAVKTYEDIMRRAAAASRMSWVDAQRVAKEVDGELQKEKNPISKILIPGLMGSNRVGLERRAQLRLLRMAVELRSSGVLKPLEDPFGGVLRGDGFKIWSLGADGVDGGGVGDWKPAKTGDIVLELPKK